MDKQTIRGLTPIANSTVDAIEQVLRETGRNDQCVCGAKRKFKKCHQRMLEEFRDIHRQPGIDWTAKFLELNVRGHEGFARLSTAFSATCVRIYRLWVSHPENADGRDDCSRVHLWRTISNDVLQEAVQEYDAVELFQSVRTIPLQALATALPGISLDELFKIVQIASSAIALHSRQTQQQVVGEGFSARAPTREQWEHWRSAAPVLIGDVLGASFSLYRGIVTYRFVGKGLRLQPQRLDENVLTQLEQAGAAAVVALLKATVDDDNIVQRSIDIYEKRKRADGALGHTGFGRIERFKESSTMAYWMIPAFALKGDVSDPSTPQGIGFYFPTFDFTIHAASYVWEVVAVDSTLELIREFGEQLRAQFGVPYSAFEQVIKTLFRAILVETGLSIAAPMSVPASVPPTMRIDANPDSSEQFAQRLFNWYGKALLPASVESWLEKPHSMLEPTHGSEASEMAGRFLSAFTLQEDEIEQSNPSLFVTMDKLVFLDGLRMYSFLEDVLAQLTTGGGDVGRVRGNLFENRCVTALLGALSMSRDDCPVKPGCDVKRGGLNYGDADFAVIVDRILVNVDMKSWQKKPGYIMGHPNAIAGRQDELEKTIVHVEQRGEALMKNLQEAGTIVDGHLSFLCVSTPEYICVSRRTLWHRLDRDNESSKVLTLSELTAMLSSDGQIVRLWAQAKAQLKGHKS